MPKSKQRLVMSNNNRVTLIVWLSNIVKGKSLAGHAALRTYVGGEDNNGHYVSFWPDWAKKENTFCTVGCFKQDENHTFETDKALEGNRDPEIHIDLYSLDVGAINKAYEAFQKAGYQWNILGSTFFKKNTIGNCASLTEFLLRAGGVDKLVSRYMVYFERLMEGLGKGSATTIGGGATYLSGMFYPVMSSNLPYSVAMARMYIMSTGLPSFVGNNAFFALSAFATTNPVGLTLLLLGSGLVVYGSCKAVKGVQQVLATAPSDIAYVAQLAQKANKPFTRSFPNLRLMNLMLPFNQSFEMISFNFITLTNFYFASLLACLSSISAFMHSHLNMSWNAHIFESSTSSYSLDNNLCRKDSYIENRFS